MKDTISSVLVAASAAIALLLGLIHLLYTFSGQNLQPRESDLMAKMKTVPLFISRDTTVWRTWIGFNASHSFSLIFFGAVYGYLAILHRAFLFHSWFLLLLGFALLLGYVVLAKLYFFRAPLLGVLLAAVLYLLGVVISLVWSTPASAR
jgi:hypothetical protein